MLTDIHRLLTSIHSVLPSILLYLWICWMYLVAFFIFLFWIIHLTKHADQFWLLQAELFRRFKEKNPDCKIGMRMFEMLKPFFCRRLKDRYTYYYEYHVPISYLKDALNYMRSQALGCMVQVATVYAISVPEAITLVGAAWLHITRSKVWHNCGSLFCVQSQQMQFFIKGNAWWEPVRHVEWGS